MKVLMINGSPHANGCTYTALSEVRVELERQGIDTELFHIGQEPIQSCLGCFECVRAKKCIVDDIVSVVLEKAKTADAYIFGSPVHYAAPTGALTALLDRFFFSTRIHANKPGAGVVVCRRGGSTAAFDQLNKYFTISSMPIVSSQYWNMVHGSTPDDILQDLEGLQTMRTLARNMAWLLKCIEAGKKAGVPLPERERTIMTNFIK